MSEVILRVVLPQGRCQCGCGKMTPIPQRTNLKKGQIAGVHQAKTTRHRKRRTPKFRFVICPTSGCWLWAGSINNDGYGRIQVNGVHTSAHRALLQAITGPIPKSKPVDHGCRNRRCCNPLHLEACSYSKNNKRIHLSAEEHMRRIRTSFDMASIRIELDIAA